MGTNLDCLLVAVSGAERTRLANGPDAAIPLARTHGCPVDSVENHRLTGMLRTGSRDFGTVGGPLVHGGQKLSSMV